MTETVRTDGPTEVTLPAIEFAEKTDPGRDPNKQVNEDACGCRATRFGHLVVVCDGMGGHAGGREASHLALATIFEVFENADPKAAPGAVLEASIVEANRRVYSMPSDEAGGRPGSTVVAILVHGDGAEVAHVGDSRCYMVHAAQIFQITKDHSMVQEMVDAGVLTPAQAATHPDANKIMRALGIAANVEVDLRREPVSYVTGDTFVLCSDGLSDMVPVDEILRVAGTSPPAQAAGQLVNIANARGGHDNITVLVVRTRESAAPSAARTTTTVNQTTPGSDVPGGSALPNRTIVAGIPEAPGSNPAASARATTVMTPFGPPLAVLPPNMSQLGGAVRSLRRQQERTTILGILFLVFTLAGLAIAYAVVKRVRTHGAHVTEDAGIDLHELEGEAGAHDPTKLEPAEMPSPATPTPAAVPELPALPPPPGASPSQRRRPRPPTP
ncbi:MAG: protein phosphatase 2C domain-containing protein [Polyangiaceae bacterium]